MLILDVQPCLPINFISNLFLFMYLFFVGTVYVYRPESFKKSCERYRFCSLDLFLMLCVSRAHTELNTFKSVENTLRLSFPSLFSFNVHFYVIFACFFCCESLLCICSTSQKLRHTCVRIYETTCLPIRPLCWTVCYCKRDF